LALCQRYYYLHVSGTNQFIGTGWMYDANNFACAIHFPVTMRTAPTSVEYGGIVSAISPSAVATNISALVLNQATPTNVGLTATATSVVGTLYSLGANNSTAAFIGVSAEL
jgi:hypothetical protein